MNGFGGHVDFFEHRKELRDVQFGGPGIVTVIYVT